MRFFLFLICFTTLSSPLPSGWKEITPPGSTICARGEPFSFFIHEGNSDKLVIDFVGGGACWSYETCAKETATFEDSVQNLKKRISESGIQGVYDFSNKLNPFKDWTYVVVPYCTGDIHWGDNVQTYKKGDKSVTINHAGARNANGVFDWLKSKKLSPKRVHVTGTSAGAYASIFWLPKLTRQFPQSKFSQLGDSGAGVVTPDFYSVGMTNWQPHKNFVNWIPGLDPRKVDWNKITFNDFYVEIGRTLTNVDLAQYNTYFDSVQVFFYELMGGTGGEEEWAQKLIENMETVNAKSSQYRYFIAPGTLHTILPEPMFYTLKSNNVSLVEWVTNFVNGNSLPNVVCIHCDP